MPLHVGIIGLPNAGKTTLFNALVRGDARVDNFAFTTIEPNRGMTNVPDPRLDRLAALLGGEKTIPAQIEFVDIAGLVEGAHAGKGRGNQFLAHVREADALLLVTRDAEAPSRDAETVLTELVLADLQGVERRQERIAPQVKGAARGAREEAAFLERLHAHLEKGKPARVFSVSREEQSWIDALFLLTRKPVLFLLNSDRIENADAFSAFAASHSGRGLALDAKLEGELNELPSAERAVFRSGEGPQADLGGVITAVYRLLDVCTFYTAEHGIVQAWPVTRETVLPVAAGKIHSRMEQGFQSADVVAYEDLERAGSLEAAHSQGGVRSRGKEYIVQEGDVLRVFFR